MKGKIGDHIEAAILQLQGRKRRKQEADLAAQRATMRLSDAEEALARAEVHLKNLLSTFNRACPVGSLVRFWPGTIRDPGRVGRTTSAAYVQGDHASVQIEGASGGIALTHVEVITAAPASADEREARAAAGGAP